MPKFELVKNSALRNRGNEDLKDLVITDTLSSYFEFKSSVLLPTSLNEGILSWNIDELASGDSILWEFEVGLMYLSELIGDTVLNRVWATVEGHPEIWFAEAKGEVLGPNISELFVNKELEGRDFSIGDMVHYSIIIRNEGEYPIRNVKVKDYFPAGLQFVEKQGPGSLDLFPSDSLEISIPVLEVGEVVTVGLVFLLTEFSEGMVNVTQVSADNAATVTDASDPLTHAKVEVGKEFSYKLTVTNNSQIEASSLEVNDFLPIELEYIRANYTTGILTYSSSGRLISWQIEKLQPGERIELIVEVRAVSAGESIVNSATVISKEEDTDYSNNESTITHTQFAIHFPNVFTPNGDGINDRWEITGISRFPNNSIEFVNRWGVTVFTSQPYRNEWTGGNLVEGTYFYSFKWIDESGQNYEKTGFVHLKR